MGKARGKRLRCPSPGRRPQSVLGVKLGTSCPFHRPGPRCFTERKDSFSRVPPENSFQRFFSFFRPETCGPRGAGRPSRPPARPAARRPGVTGRGGAGDRVPLRTWSLQRPRGNFELAGAGESRVNHTLCRVSEFPRERRLGSAADSPRPCCAPRGPGGGGRGAGLRPGWGGAGVRAAL